MGTILEEIFRPTFNKLRKYEVISTGFRFLVSSLFQQKNNPDVAGCAYVADIEKIEELFVENCLPLEVVVCLCQQDFVI